MARSRKSPAPVIPDGDDLDPDPLDYSPKAVLADTEAAKDLLLFLRKEGITVTVVTIGTVQLTGVIDHFPRAKISEQMRFAAGPRRGASTEREDDLDEFATPEERRILRDDTD